ncbi:unnamed protein product [Ostreobium quekettii]|uniref:Uncharacterized protein n=1 Tax=Ostreobium quekettii TaxID=121088 RepID=A0A8S1IVK7_9CHLO|nr:unnamed protein product [Ostreobium quekettii]|eukprot:evm.model.scf_439.8 EVM.evm.TU.scf_439.8   scf_439:53214-59071(-)
MKAAAQKAAAASKAAASKAAAGKAAGGKASGLKKKAAATAKGSALGRVVAAKQAAATWAEAVKAKAGKGEGRGRGGAEGKGTAKGGEADVFNPSFVSSLIQGSRELVARDGSQQVAGLANAEEGAKDKKELLRAMVVVDSLQRQLDSEGSARKRMIHKLKKEQKRAKLMCEILREQQAMFLYESNDAPQDNAGDGSDSGLSSSMQRNGAVNEIAAKIQRIEKEVKDRESQMQELESVQIEFEKDADNLRQTVHGTLKELGARGAESATVRKEIEGLRAAVKGSLDKIRRREEEKERKIARQQQARDEFFLTRLSEVEARAAAAERELGAVTHGVGRLDSTLMRAESRLMGNDALGVSSPIRTSPHMSRAASPLRGTCALTFAGSQGAFRPTTATHCDFHHPPSRCCCSHAGAGSPGWQSSPASPRSFSPLSHSPAGWSDVPQYCASRRCPTNHGFDPGAQGMTDSTRQRHAPGRSVSFQEGHHESVNFENDSRRGRAITIPTTTTMNSSYWDAAPKSGVGGEGAETGTSRMPNGETCSPQDGGQQREATPLESQASTGRDTSHPECTPNTVGRNTHTDPRHAAGPTLSQGTDELPPGASRGLDIKSATDVLKGALEDVRSQLNSGEGDAHLLARLEDFMGKLHEIEGEHDAKVRSLESEWSTRLARAEERLAQSLEVGKPWRRVKHHGLIPAGEANTQKGCICCSRTHQCPVPNAQAGIAQVPAGNRPACSNTRTCRYKCSQTTEKAILVGRKTQWERVAAGDIWKQTGLAPLLSYNNHAWPKSCTVRISRNPCQRNVGAETNAATGAIISVAQTQLCEHKPPQSCAR